MRNQWILDVLSDLRTFAERNGLPRLAEEFDGTLRRTALELAAHDGRDHRAPSSAPIAPGPGLDP